MKTMLIKLGSLILRALPIEQILATALNRAIAKVGDNNMTAALKTLEHLQEICDLTADILRDRTVSVDEAGQIVGRLKDLRLELLNRWADGRPDDDVKAQIKTLTTDTEPSYA